MMKWLRKHMKQIMVVVVLLAMLSFVGGPAIQSIGSRNRGNEAYAMAFGRELTYNDRLSAQNDTSVLEDLRVPWQYDPEGNTTVDHWYLLAEEAKRAGIQVSDEEVERGLQQCVDNLTGMGFPADYLDSLRSRKVTIVNIRHALRRHLAIQKNVARVQMASMPSDAQVRHYVRDTEDKVNIRFAAMDARRFIDEQEPLEEELILAQFEKFKDIALADSETGEGYQHPRRVKVQYIQVSIPQVEPQMEVSFEDAKAYWKRNKAKYTKSELVEVPATTAPATTAPATTQPTTQPLPEPKMIRQQVQMAFSEAREKIEQDLRKKKADQVVIQAMKEVAKELLAPWIDLTTDPKTGYKPIPPGVSDPDYMRSIAERIGGEFGITLNYAETSLLSATELDALPALQGAAMSGPGPIGPSLSEIAFHSPTFIENATDRDAGLCLQLHQAPDSPLEGSGAGGGYMLVDGRLVQQKTTRVLFRVVEAREAEAPQTVEEVRSKVERDLRLARAFDRVEAVAKELYVAASHLGIDEALKRFDDLRTKRGVRAAISPPPFARRVGLGSSRQGQFRYIEALLAGKPTLVPPEIRGVGTSEEFVDACFHLVTDSWELPLLERPVTDRTIAATTQPAATPQPVLRLLPVLKLKKWFLIELIGTEEVDSDMFDSELRATAHGRITWEQSFALRGNWFKPLNIEARCGFEPIEAAPPASANEGIETAQQPRPQPRPLGL